VNGASEKATPASNSPAEGRGRVRNPYLPTAVAVIEEETGSGITVATASIRQGRRCLDSYVKAYPMAPRPGSGPARTDPETEEPSPGNVVAVVGEHGTGKTHLLGDLLVRFADQGGADRHALYVEASRHRTFLSIYLELMHRLQGEHKLHERVQEYYVDLAVEDLGRSPIMQSYANQLREGVRTPEDVDRVFGIDSPELMTALAQRLQAVTHDPDFGLALSFLHDPSLREPVKAWLLGEPPAPLLMERGIKQAIDTEERALEAIGVFALIYGRRNHRLMLAIDEIDRIIMPTGGRPGSAESAFKKLLEVFVAAHGLLVIAGLPDFLRILRPDTLQRISTVIEMTSMTLGQVEEYVLRTHKRFLGRESIDPFTPDALRCVTQITGGIPRQVIRLLQLTFEVAHERSSGITTEVVLETAPSLATSSREKVRSATASILAANSLPYEPDRRASLLPRSRVDFWIPFPGQGAGCGLIVADSVLTSADVDELSGRAQAVRDGQGEVVARLVIAGWLSPEHRDLLGDVFGAAPLIYNQRTFDADLLALIRAAGARAGGDLAPVQDQVRQLGWQQRDLHRSMDQVLAVVQNLQLTAERGFEGLAGRLPGRATGGREGSAHNAGPVRELPPAVTALFARAKVLIEERYRLPRSLEEIFAPPTPGQPVQDRSAAMAELRTVLGRQDAMSALGLISALGYLVDAFESGVTAWYTQWNGLREEQRPAARDALIEICRRYDELFSVLPLHLAHEADQPFDTFPDAGEESATFTTLAARTMQALLSVV
jgi:Cdc6-like AAA superfamily ATPase